MKKDGTKHIRFLSPAAASTDSAAAAPDESRLSADRDSILARPRPDLLDFLALAPPAGGPKLSDELEPSPAPGLGGIVRGGSLVSFFFTPMVTDMTV